MGFKPGRTIHRRLGGGKYQRAGFVFFCDAINTRIQQSIDRIKKRSGAAIGAAGKVVGRYYLEPGGRYEFMTDKIENDLRHGLEFIMRVRSFYTLSDLIKTDYITFFTLLEECEAEQKEAIARAKEKQ